MERSAGLGRLRAHPYRPASGAPQILAAREGRHAIRPTRTESEETFFAKFPAAPALLLDEDWASQADSDGQSQIRHRQPQCSPSASGVQIYVLSQYHLHTACAPIRGDAVSTDRRIVDSIQFDAGRGVLRKLSLAPGTNHGAAPRPKPPPPGAVDHGRARLLRGRWVA